MSTSWYAKVDSGFHSNRKCRKAGRLGREIFIFVLCQNARRGSTGVIPSADLESWFLADQLQMDEPEALEGVRLATLAGLIEIDGDTVKISGWDDSWGKLPSSNAGRQARFRERHAGPTEGMSNGASVTSNDSTVTRNAKSNAVTQVLTKGSRKGGSVTRNALSPDFAPSESTRLIASDKGLNVSHELAQFRDHCASSSKTSADWDAEFRKWLRADDGRNANRTPAAAPTSGPRVTYQRTALNPNHFYEVVDGETTRLVEKLPDGTHRALDENGRSA